MAEAPYATCPRCGDPLVATFTVKFKEWVCVECRTFFEFLQARSGEATPEMAERSVALTLRWQSFRAEIQAWADEAKNMKMPIPPNDFVRITQAEYDALPKPLDGSTFYVITD